MPYEKDPNEIGALWMKTSSAGKEYMTGTVNGERIVVFRAKKSSDKSPDWRVLKSVPKDEHRERPMHNANRSEADDSDIIF